MNDETRPCYVISVAAEILGVRSHTLRYYEKVGIIKPSRSQGNVRLYSESDIAQLRRVRHLMDDLGVNLAGIEVILRMLHRMTELQSRLGEMETDFYRRREVVY